MPPGFVDIGNRPGGQWGSLGGGALALIFAGLAINMRGAKKINIPSQNA